MKLKRILISSISAIIFATFLFAQNITYATNATTPLYLGITELMSGNKVKTDANGTEGYLGYAIGNPTANSSTDIKAAKIWNIVKYSSETSSDPTDASIFCLKAGVGFTDTKKTEKYDVFFDMKTEKEAIKSKITALSSIMDDNVSLDNGEQVSRYNAILALLDMFYIKDQSKAEEKQALLEAANIYEEYYDDGAVLNEDDVKAVQQAALWYFTNPEKTDVYDKTENTSWLNYTTDGKTYKSLSDYNPSTSTIPSQSIGHQKQEQAEMLYNYLIDTAKEKAKNYSDNIIQEPAKINTTTLKYEDKDNNYIVGPINISESGNNIPYTISLEVKNGDTGNVSGISLLDKNKQSTDKTLNNIKELVGEDFYLSIPKNNVTIANIKVGITIGYSNTKLTLWGSNTNNSAQPVVIPEKENQSKTVTLTTETKKFDLALRKYITKVNGKELTGKDSRVPKIDNSTLQSGTTATYKHKKNPVTVETGDVVTYEITIYNEGEKLGRPTKIVDQLPTGLEFNNKIKGNFDLGSYDKTNNTLTLIREEDNEEDLEPYKDGKIDSETIEIECKVTATQDATNNKVLTNVAWISEEIDSESNVTITNQGGADRDSEPSTIPSVNKDNMSNYTGNNNKSDLSDSEFYYKGQQDDDDFEKLVLVPETFDLKLIKRITAVNNQNVPERIQKVDVSKLNTTDENGKLITTGDYQLDKNPVQVKKGDIVTYTFRIYNEGTIDGYASEITEDIPKGLEFIWSDKTGEELKQDTTLTEAEKEAIEFNQKYLWSKFVYDDKKENIIQVSTDYLSKKNETAQNSNLIKAFGKNDGTKTEKDISYKEVSIKLKVVADNATGTIIRNEAEISEDTDKDEHEIDDRDSDTENWKKYEDDEDYDNITLTSFDLALRKFIIAVSNDTNIEESEYLKNSDGTYKRSPEVDTTKLNTQDENGNLITTATYNHTKEPVQVKKNDIVVYMLRVYNEGDVDGYASEIKDHLPPYLEFVEGEFNEKYGWTVSENGRTVTTTYLKDSKITKATKNSSGKYVLAYKEVPIMCKVKDTVNSNEKITNIADITKYQDENKKDITDRDSQANNVELPSDNNLPSYKDNETGSYIPGQQDDDDFEKVYVEIEPTNIFDLALRKFITKIDDKDVTTRVPQVKYADGKITYEHSKDPLMVKTDDVVIYTIRVFNEGEIAGYAKEITDDIPEGLEFLPDNEVNKDMRWKMIDKDGKETTKVSEAVKITTDYLSKEQEKTEGANLLNAFDPSKEISNTNPAYKDVQVAFKVTEPNSSSKIIVNSAQISDDSDKDGKDVEDKDSIPDKWNEGEDDQDKEYIQLKEFDLALRKWVTQAIVVENGKQTVTNTGHKPYDDPEQVVKVELNRKKLDQVTVKFRYSIRVINEGDVEGYAKEVTDYIPEGLKFVASDNPGWTDEGNNVISTKLLENKLLKPGEYADIEVVLTWINNADNMGTKTNIAEISKDYNEYGLPDRDSTPDNKKQGEDDIDDAPVALSISTGQVRIFFTIGFIVLITIASGIILIKKYVL